MSIHLLTTSWKSPGRVKCDHGLAKECFTSFLWVTSLFLCLQRMFSQFEWR
ncbi:hypothetical protein CFBP2118_04450 [Pseudomonas syringae pv. syringae]|nr:hypothetical protein ALP85_200072 [Pseudomonas syringae pv. syringae]SOQ03380.1 hypothetical protein CFBP2118_04450 [Pseudomonas syringae pv. syringae]